MRELAIQAASLTPGSSQDQDLGLEPELPNAPKNPSLQKKPQAQPKIPHEEPGNPDQNLLQLEFEALKAEIDRIANVIHYNGRPLLNADHTVSLQVGAGTAPEINCIDLDLKDMRSEALGISSADIGNEGQCNSAVEMLDGAIDQVTSMRGSLGSFINRMVHAMHHLDTETENVTASESRIRVLDLAAETADLTKNSIRQQSTVALLLHALHNRQRVLTLLETDLIQAPLEK